MSEYEFRLCDLVHDVRCDRDGKFIVYHPSDSTTSLVQFDGDGPERVSTCDLRPIRFAVPLEVM